LQPVSFVYNYFHSAPVLHKSGIIRRKGKTLLMNRWLFVLLMAVAFAPGFVSAQDTAYKALRAVGAQRGEKALNQVVAIVGQSGRPQPVAWRVTLDDPGEGSPLSELHPDLPYPEPGQSI
jgi:hypothetical protein